MNDIDIIKALECCGTARLRELHTGENPCSNCPMQDCEDCEVELPDCALDLINRQQAEIEKLKIQLNKREEFFTVKLDKAQLENIVKAEIKKFSVDADTIRAEAIKEFVKQHKEIMREFLYNDSTDFMMKWCEYETNTDNLLKEMVGDTDA